MRVAAWIIGDQMAEQLEIDAALQAAGYEVVNAKNGPQGIDMARETPRSGRC
jgi:CheY-like chemotaxis protein